MMTDAGMTDAEVADQIERADRFRQQLRDAISEAVVDCNSPCADAKRQGLQRIAATLDQVSVVTLLNLSTLDIATRGVVMMMVEVALMAVGGGPLLDYADATAFLAPFERIVDGVRKRRQN